MTECDPAHRDRVLRDLKRIFPDLKSLADRLASRPDAAGRGLESLSGNEEVSEARARARESGLVGLSRVLAGSEGHISAEEIFGLEAIVHEDGRPALLVVNGDFESPPPEWDVLNDHRHAIQDALRKVGCIETTVSGRRDWIGTGFLAGPEAVMTNMHVAQSFCTGPGRGGEWTFRPGVEPSLNLLREEGSAERLAFAISEVLGFHESHDLAMLRIERVSSDGELPAPLPVAAMPPDELAQRRVYVIGYPSEDPERNVPEEMARVFKGEYGVKQLQPGEIDCYVEGDYLEHDCSTLGGNSGSPVIDLETHEVLGLHFAGVYGEANFAVPLWTLREDPLIVRGDVNFT